jgi:hypothetical protein
MTTAPSELHAALRAWAKGIYPTEAATELLIRSGAATTGDPWIQPGDDPGWWWVDFEALAHALNEGTHHSGGERRILSIAASLGGHSPDGFRLGDALPGLDRAHLALVLAATAHAGGSHEHHDMMHADPLPPLFDWPQDNQSS